MDSKTWDRIQVEARRRIRQREQAQEARVAAQERAEEAKRRDAARPQNAPPLGFVAELLEHKCPDCGERHFIQRELMASDQKCSGCDFVGVFTPREES